MNRILYIFCFGQAAFVIASGWSCQKKEIVPPISRSSAITIVNATPNSASVIPVIGTANAINYFSNAKAIGYGSFSEYPVPVGDDTVYAVENSSDTLEIGPKSTGSVFFSVLKFSVGGIYSLFLTGMDTSSPDYLFIADLLPYHSPTDSVFGVRFINLSTGSGAVQVSMAGSAAGSEVTSLPYKGITGFMSYTASSTSPSTYTFQFTDLVSGDALGSFRFSGILNGTSGNTKANAYRFRNFTVALIGNPNGPVSQQAILINNY